MIDDIDGHRIANAILMDDFNGTYLLVEGKNDQLLFSKFVPKDHCEIRITNGYKNCVDAIEKLNSLNQKPVLGIIDLDFRAIQGEINTTDNLYFTDFHDIEMMAFASEAFETILDSYCNEEKLEKIYQEKKNNNLREILLEIIKPLSHVKWLNYINNFGFPFKSFNPDSNDLELKNFIDSDTLDYQGHSQMITAIFNYARNKVRGGLRVNNQTLLELLSQSMYNHYDLYQICNGHDLLELVSIALRKKLSNVKSQFCKCEILEKELILAYDSRYFQRTNLYKNIKDWEIYNQRIVLKF